MYNKISEFRKNTQRYLFPILEEEIGPLSKTHLKLAEVLELVQIERFLPDSRGCRGRPPKYRSQLARAFIAKIILKLKYTDQLIDFLISDRNLRLLCGWETARAIPKKHLFSRAFAEFAESELPQVVHTTLVREIYEDQRIGHLCIDSTPIEAREKTVKIKKVEPEKKGKRKPKPMTRSELQASGSISLKQMLADMPRHCAIAVKQKPGLTNFKWKGYKLHLAVDDMGVPVTAHLTSASINDHEMAIPLTLMSKDRVQHFYQLMDSAYDVVAVKEFIRSQGHVPIVDRKPYNVAQKKDKAAEEKRRAILNWKSASDIRYRERFKAERPNALLKEYYGANDVQYKGYSKVACHIMFGVLALAANTLLGFT